MYINQPYRHAHHKDIQYLSINLKIMQPLIDVSPETLTYKVLSHASNNFSSEEITNTVDRGHNLHVYMY